MRDIGLADREIELIRSVFRRFPAIAEVVLYGSRAKRTYGPQSDVDLALVGMDDQLQVATVADELDALPLPYRFDVTAYEKIQYEPLHEHIARVGIVFYTRDPHGDRLVRVGRF